jgi:Ner family transcriptional regulator
LEGDKPKKWNRHLILATIKDRFGSLTEFAATTPLSRGHFSVAARRPYPKAEAFISQALDVPLNQLWPDRYDATGRRRRRASRQSGNSQRSA